MKIQIEFHREIRIFVVSVRYGLDSLFSPKILNILFYIHFLNDFGPETSIQPHTMLKIAQKVFETSNRTISKKSASDGLFQGMV